MQSTNALNAIYKCVLKQLATITHLLVESYLIKPLIMRRIIAIPLS